MGKSTELVTRTPEIEKQASISQIRKPDSSQSRVSRLDRLLFLQRTIGNQAVQRMLASEVLKAPLRFAQSNDRYEQEAKPVVEKLMRMREPHVDQQLEEREKEALMQKQAGGETPSVGRGLEAQINSMRGKGQRPAPPMLQYAPAPGGRRHRSCTKQARTLPAKYNFSFRNYFNKPQLCLVHNNMEVTISAYWAPAPKYGPQPRSFYMTLAFLDGTKKGTRKVPIGGSENVKFQNIRKKGTCWFRLGPIWPRDHKARVKGKVNHMKVY